MTDLERRYTRGAVEMRAGDGETPRIGGYAAKYDKISQNLGGFVERIAPGFFDASRDAGWAGMMARYNHELLLGTTEAGSLRLALDDTGLDYEVDLLDDAASVRVLKLVQRGDVHQSSFAFYVAEDEWTMSEQGFPLRTLIGGKTADVAPVDQPAYLDTSTGLRSLADKVDVAIEEIRSLAAQNDLAKILKAPPVVVDLGSPTPIERGETCGSAVRLERMRLALKEKLAD